MSAKTIVFNEHNKFDFEVTGRGINRHTNKWYVDMTVLFEQDNQIKEYVIYATAKGVTEKDMQIIDFHLEFLDPTYYSTVEVAFNKELFKEIYDMAYDEFYCIFDELELAKKAF